MKRAEVIATVVIIAVVSLVAVAIKREATSPITVPDVSQGQPGTVANSNAPTSPRILTKVAEFGHAWNGEKDEESLLLRYSPAYKEATDRIASKVNTISDPKLREEETSDERSSIDSQTRSGWLTEAKASFKQYQSKFLSDNADKLFEIGRIGYTERPFELFGNVILGNEFGNNRCNPESTRGFAWIKRDDGTRLLELCRDKPSFVGNPIAIKLSVVALDGLLRQFDALHQSEVESCIDGLFAKNNMSRSTAPVEAVDEARQSCLPQSRKNLSVVAQGNLLAKSMNKVYVMDFETEKILAEIPASDVVGLLDYGWGWSTPSKSGICRSEVDLVAQGCD